MVKTLILSVDEPNARAILHELETVIDAAKSVLPEGTSFPNLEAVRTEFRYVLHGRD